MMNFTQYLNCMREHNVADKLLLIDNTHAMYTIIIKN